MLFPEGLVGAGWVGTCSMPSALHPLYLLFLPELEGEGEGGRRCLVLRHISWAALERGIWVSKNSPCLPLWRTETSRNTRAGCPQSPSWEQWMSSL